MRRLTKIIILVSPFLFAFPVMASPKTKRAAPKEICARPIIEADFDAHAVEFPTYFLPPGSAVEFKISGRCLIKLDATKFFYPKGMSLELSSVTRDRAVLRLSIPSDACEGELKQFCCNSEFGSCHGLTTPIFYVFSDPDDSVLIALVQILDPKAIEAVPDSP